MTISQALISLNSFPIPDLFIEKVGVERDLTITEDYTSAIAVSSAFELATADVYMWLSKQPSIVEQETGINQLGNIKDSFIDLANAIYAKYNDPKFTGRTYGFIGENFNG